MESRAVSRRRVLGFGVGALAAGATLAACGTAKTSSAPSTTMSVPPTSAPTTTTAVPTAAARAPGAPAVALSRGQSGRPQVALTFHGSGPVSITRQILDILAAHSAHATVFAIGQWLAASPEVAKLILDGGHELGNHTWSHPPLSTYGPEAMYTEITRCRDELVKLTGTPGAFFRQSDGQYATPQECVQAGLAGYDRILNYDIDSTDWEGASESEIRSAVAGATAGSVISLHLGRRNTIAALPAVLTDLGARGLAGVTGAELLR